MKCGCVGSLLLRVLLRVGTLFRTRGSGLGFWFWMRRDRRCTMHTEAEERDGVVRRRAGGAIPERLVAVERHLQCVGGLSCAAKCPSSVSEALGRATRRPRPTRVSATRGAAPRCAGACVGAAAHSDDDIEQVSSDGVGARCSAAALHSGTNSVLPRARLPCAALHAMRTRPHAAAKQPAHYDSDS